MLEVIIFSIFVGFLRSRTLKGLLEIKITLFPLVLAALLLRFVAVVLGGKGYSFFIHYGPYIQIVSFAALIYVLIINGSSLRLVAVGVVLNFLVILANGGLMPVSAAAISRAELEDMDLYVTHTYVEEDTPLWFLADIIPVPPPYPHNRVVSIGDIILAGGLFLFIQRSMFFPKERSRVTK